MICYSNGVLATDFNEGDKLQRLSRKWKRFVINAEDYKEDKLIIYYKRHKSSKMLFWNVLFSASLIILFSNTSYKVLTLAINLQFFKSCHPLLKSNKPFIKR